MIETGLMVALAISRYSVVLQSEKLTKSGQILIHQLMYCFNVDRLLAVSIYCYADRKSIDIFLIT